MKLMTNVSSFALLTFAVLCLMAPIARAVNPAPDGGYPGENTAEGDLALASLPNGGGAQNTAIGYSALYSNTTGFENTAIGWASLLSNMTGQANTATGANALFYNTAGVDNTAIGVNALQLNITGSGNTGTGFGALQSNDADNNTATGYQALFQNTTGAQNTAMGAAALLSNTTGAENTASGDNALGKNTTGTQNTATGASALASNTTGNLNTATGEAALFSNTTGKFNTATGLNALSNNTTGISNTATGLGALFVSTTGGNNTATGVSALGSNKSGGNNTAEGFQALENSTGSNNIGLGSNAGINLTTGSNNIDIGSAGAAGESGKIRIGKQGTQNGTFIAGISGVAVTGSPVVVNSSGKLGIGGTSSIRFKEAVKPMDNASEAILGLKPVTFRYKEEVDPDNAPQFGLVAEDVEKVDPKLVAHDEEGKPFTVRYEAVNAMLLNEFLKEHRKVQKLEATVAQQQKDFKDRIAAQQRQIEMLTITLRKVSNRSELGGPKPELVATTH